MAAQLDTLDMIVLSVLLVGTVLYFTKGTLWGSSDDPYGNSLDISPKRTSTQQSRFLDTMQESNKNCIVFYGSQTGTAEDYARRLSKEGSDRFGLRTMTADLERYCDYEALSLVSSDQLVVFVLATYGEGEPTDNAAEFYNFLMSEDVQFATPEDGELDEELPLKNLKYVAFGLGNHTYEHYNSMVREVSKRLTTLGATCIGPAGEGDDAAGTMEEDFLAWKELMWAELSPVMGLEERDMSRHYNPVYNVTERGVVNPLQDRSVYLGEPSRSHLLKDFTSRIDAHNPYIAPIKDASQLFRNTDRECLHVEIDLAGAKTSYTTGDHIAIWPSNPSTEVDLFLKTFGLEDKRHHIINVQGVDSMTKIPFPVCTTYDSVIRYYLEICAPVSRQSISSLAMFAPADGEKDGLDTPLGAKLAELGKDSVLFVKEVTSRNFNIAQFLSHFAPGVVWESVPFSLIIESLNRIQPRYYSISSSSVVSPSVVSITAAVESVSSPNSPVVVKGVTTNYLNALKKSLNHEDDPNPLKYDLAGPRGNYKGFKIPVHIRASNFKLPSNDSYPIIMVGPGTGVAPFRAFMQERYATFKRLRERGKESLLGKAILYYGCRREEEDYLYADEWKMYKKEMGDKFDIHVAFSRKTEQKVYVQHLMKSHAAEISDMLSSESKGYFYVCGDAANMAREVNTGLGAILAQARGITEEQGRAAVKQLRTLGRYQEDVWS